MRLNHKLCFSSSAHQGSPSFISSTSGFLTEHLLLLAYGEVFVSDQNAASWQNPYSFTGKEQDMESGLHYFGARYYLAEIGMWLSTDPLADQFANVSPYAYAANNPAFFTDRWGLAANPPACWTEFQGHFRQMLPNAANDGEIRYGGYSSVVGEVTTKKMTKAEKLARRVADDIRNMPMIGNHSNPLYLADAVFVDIGFCFVGAEFDWGLYFILSGKDKGSVLFYDETAAGMSTDSGIGLEFGRVDAEMSPEEFISQDLYGARMKYWTSFSPTGELLGVGYSYARATNEDGKTVHSNAIQIGLSVSPFPFLMGGGSNKGIIK